MTNQALALAQPLPLLPAPETFRMMLDMADVLLKSGLMPAHIRTPQAAFAVIQKGAELGVPPMYALSNIVVVNGRPGANAELMQALIYRDQGDMALRFVESTDRIATLEYRRRGWAKPERYSFTIEMARQAGLAGNKGPWTQYPAAMLRARAISAVARMAFADSIGGMHLPEELGAQVEVRDGEVVVLPERPAPPPAVPPDPPPAPTVPAPSVWRQALHAELARRFDAAGRRMPILEREMDGDARDGVLSDALGFLVDAVAEDRPVSEAGRAAATRQIRDYVEAGLALAVEVPSSAARCAYLHALLCDVRRRVLTGEVPPRAAPPPPPADDDDADSLPF